MKVLITGGAGYIGSVLCKHLLNLNYNVTVYDNLMYKQLSLIEHCGNPNFDLILADVRDTERLKRECQRADIILPLAAIVGAPACEKDKQLTTDVNLNHIISILNCTNKNQKIIFPCTNSGYGIGQKDIYCTEDSPLKPISHYGITKVTAESLCLESKRAVTLRLATVFGISPRMRLDLLVNDFTFKALADGYLVLFEENFTRNFIHIQDVARTFLFAILHYDEMVGKPFNVGLSSANISKRILAETIKKYIPKLSIQSDTLATDPDQRNYIVSNERLEKLGWYAKVSLEDGIQELLKAYRIILNHSNFKFTNL